MSATESSKILREWKESAAYWREHYSTIRSMFAPVTNALIEEAGIGKGNIILDVAGGSGEPSLTIAETIGPTGLVTCTDAVSEMVQAAEQEARRRGIRNIEFRQSLADSLSFEDNSFDATLCRLGVMFFPDVLAALKEMLRVTKTEGVVSFAVWGRSDLNPFVYVVTDVVARYTEMPPALPDAPGAFRFAEPGKLAQILTEASAKDVRERLLKFQIEAPISPREYWEMRSRTSATLREKLGSLPDEQAEKAALEVQEVVGEFFLNGQMSFPAQMLVVTGSKIR